MCQYLADVLQLQDIAGPRKEPMGQQLHSGINLPKAAHSTPPCKQTHCHLLRTFACVLFPVSVEFGLVMKTLHTQFPVHRIELVKSMQFSPRTTMFV